MEILTPTERAVLDTTADGLETLERIYQRLHAAPAAVPLAETADAVRSLLNKGLVAPRVEEFAPEPSRDDPSIYWKSRFALTDQGRDARSIGDGGDATDRRRSLFGIWRDLGLKVTREDIDELRREMWGNFPRDEPK